MSGVLLGALNGTPDLVATISPSSVSGFRVGPGFVQTSAPAVVTILSGVAPFTQLWTRTSGAVFTIDSPTSLSTTWSATIAIGNNTGVYQCVVTDALGRSTPPLVVNPVELDAS